MIPASKAAQWIAAKEAERIAQETRRQLEDEMAREFGFTMVDEGTQNFESVDPSGAKGAHGKPITYKVKIVGRMNRKVNGDELQDLAREAGLEQFLTTLFKWEPDLRLAAWKATDKSITDKLAGAITTTPGRPSFSVEVIEQKAAK